MHLTFINIKGDIQSFTLNANEIETVFDLANRLVNGGCKLTSAYISTEFDRPLSLPVEAFDGIKMEEQLKGLQKEWERILYLA